MTTKRFVYKGQPTKHYIEMKVPQKWHTPKSIQSSINNHCQANTQNPADGTVEQEKSNSSKEGGSL